MNKYEDLNIERLKEITEELFLTKPRRTGMTFHTGPQGYAQFEKALKYESLRRIIELSDKPLETKKRLFTLLNTGLDTDFNLVNEIMKTTLNYDI